MRPGDIELGKKIIADLISFGNKQFMPGIKSNANFSCFVEQIIDSIRRIKYIKIIQERENSSCCANPYLTCFDPLKAAVWYKNQGNINEAFWLVFLSVHFGKHKKSRWHLVRNIYGGLQNKNKWDWIRTSSDPFAFREWLHNNLEEIKKSGSVGNHRKYISLNAFKDNGTGAVINSYIDWIGSTHDHQNMVKYAQSKAGSDPRAIFDFLYTYMDKVVQFGRLARFDYLTMVGKLGLARIEPGSLYLKGSSGPLLGARLLFGGSTNAKIEVKALDSSLNELETQLNLYFGMQVLEDALCNWQKSPEKYFHFSG